MNFGSLARRGLCAFASLALAAAAPAQELTLERITADPPLAGRLPLQAELSPGGRWVSLLRPSAADSGQLELWVQPADGAAPRRVVGAAELLQGQAQRLSEAEKMQLERRRIKALGITSYQWCGQSDDALLFPYSGDLYLARLGAAEPQLQRLTQEPDSPKQDPRCAPDGKRLAYVKGGNLWLQELGGKPRPLTRDGGRAEIGWGLAEFIAAEEFDRQRGFWWSPDSRRLLALRVDESRVPLKMRAQIHAERTELYPQRYPAAGEPNAQLTAWVIDAGSGRRQALQLPAEAEYIVRAGWFADGKPWLQWMPRDQRRLVLAEFDAQGRSRTVTEERDEAWVEVHDDLLELPGGATLLWSSEAAGRRQLLLVDRASGERRPFIALREPVARAICANAEGLVFAAATERGRGRELYRSDWSGRVLPLPGDWARQWRDAQGDSACTQLLETRSAFGQPPQLALRRADGQGEPLLLAGDPPDPLLAQVLRRPLVLDLPAADGRTALSAFYFAPQNLALGQHPVIAQVYGGPGSADVRWAWDRDSPLIAYWTRRGYGVFLLDTRGMANRDRAFTRAHHRAIGQVELADLFAAVRALPRLVPHVDPARIGVFGWSYGGFLAARAVLDEASPFAAAAAVAPVTDWRLYDSAYTERYLGLPQADDGRLAEAYARADLPSRAALLSRPLLLAHGMADDNVLFEHSLRLMEALQNQGKLFDTLIYPGKAHGLAGRQAQLHLYRSLDAFFDRHLRPWPWRGELGLPP